MCEHKRTVPVCLCIKSVPGRGGGAGEGKSGLRNSERLPPSPLQGSCEGPLANAKQAPLFIFTEHLLQML